VVPVGAWGRGARVAVLLTARDTPAWVLAYLINPLDLVPDALVGIELTDGLHVLALERASGYVTLAVRERARALSPARRG